MIGTVGSSITAADIGQTLGPHGSVIMLASPMCRPCQAARTRLHLARSAAPGVHVIDINVATAYEVAQAFGVRATPTVLFLSPTGIVLARLDGQVPPQTWWRTMLAHLPVV